MKASGTVACFLALSCLLADAASFFPLFSKTDSPAAVVGPPPDPSGFRGVTLQRKDFYDRDEFICDEGSTVLGRGSINDGYCDCNDGSDEPGTSACTTGTFTCINHGYRLIQIPSSRVDDGVCDCCDGSDEGQVITCVNSCAVSAAKERDMIVKVTTAYKTGSVVRKADVYRMIKEKEALESRLEPLRRTVVEQEEVVDSIRAAKEEEDRVNDETSKTVTDKATNDANEILVLDDMTEKQLAPLLSSLFTLLELSNDDVKGTLELAGFHLRYQPPPPAYTDYSTTSHDYDHHAASIHDRDDDVEGGGEDGEEEEHERGDYFPKDDEDSSVENIPPEVGVEGVEEGGIDAVGLPDEVITPCDLNAYSDDKRLSLICEASEFEEAPQDEQGEGGGSTHNKLVSTAKTAVLEFLRHKKCFAEMQLLIGYYKLKGGSFDGVLEFAQTYKLTTAASEAAATATQYTCPAEFSQSNDNNGAEYCQIGEKLESVVSSLENIPPPKRDQNDKFDAANSELTQRNSDLTQAEDALRKYEEHAKWFEYLAIKDQRFDVIDGKFTYSVNVMGKVTQAEADGGGEVSLGQFNSIEENTKTGGAVMKFTMGQYCWNFGDRTADVFISCGPANKLISATEPSTCYYTFEMESPAACTEAFAHIHGINI